MVVYVYMCVDQPQLTCDDPYPITDSVDGKVRILESWQQVPCLLKFHWIHVMFHATNMWTYTHHVLE